MEKAREVATRLCFHYAISGALAFQDEAISEAYKALWLRCQRFDPKRQKLQWMAEQKNRKAVLWALLSHQVIPDSPEYSPYSNFWIASVQYVRGSVLDFFRAQRLITKRVKGHEVTTMLYAERFVSLDRTLGEVTNGAYGKGAGLSGQGESFGDMLASSDRSDASDDQCDLRDKIEAIKNKSNLTSKERRVVDLLYGEEGYSKEEVARKMRVSVLVMKELLSCAMRKMRDGVSSPAVLPVVRIKISNTKRPAHSRARCV